MGFLSPWWLAGIAAVGLPLWLHLLRQFKRTPLPFSSSMFLERREQSSVRHRRLRYLALLAMRMALLILLALAFANPFVVRQTEMAGRKRLTVIALDRSFSMRYGSRLNDAKAEARKIVAGLGGRDLAEVVAFDSHLETLTQQESDKGALLAAIDAIQPVDRASNFGEFARALRVLDQNDGLAVQVHLISDVQETSMPRNFADLQVGPHTGLVIHPVGESKAPNWAVESVSTAAHVYDAKHTRLTAVIAGWQTAARDTKVSLVLNNRVLATKDVAVPANGRAQVEFLGFEVPYGASRGEVRVEQQDSLPDDDHYAFSVERSDPRKVLFLYSDGRVKDAFYYRAAMESSADTGFTVQPLALEQASGEDFSKFAFVVLNDAGNLDPQLAQELCMFIEKGGAVLLSLGVNSGSGGKVPLSNDRFSVEHMAQGAGYVDNQSPAMSGVGGFENVQFFRSLRLTPKGTARVMAKLADGSPLLVEERMGEGRLLIFASALDNSTNDFPLHSSFLPFVVQSGRYLAGADEAPSSVMAGTPVTLRRKGSEGTAADVVGPDGKHELSLSESTKALSFDLMRSGFYEVQRADGRRLLMAVNADRRESDLKQVPAETLELWRNTGNMAAAGGNSVREQMSQPWSLGRYALILVLIAALVESIFASRYLREERRTG